MVSDIGFFIGTSIIPIILAIAWGGICKAIMPRFSLRMLVTVILSIILIYRGPIISGTVLLTLGYILLFYCGKPIFREKGLISSNWFNRKYGMLFNILGIIILFLGFITQISQPFK